MADKSRLQVFTETHASLSEFYRRCEEVGLKAEVAETIALLQGAIELEKSFGGM